MMTKKLQNIKTGVICLLVTPAIVFANSEDNSEEEYDFDWSAIGQEIGVNLDRNSYESFRKEMHLGTHVYEIYVDNKYLCQEKVDITLAKGTGELVAAIPVKLLHQISLKDEYQDRVSELSENTKVVTLQNILPGASIELNEESSTINIAIPQIYKLEGERHIANENLWDYGIPALRLNYDLDVSRNRFNHQSTDRSFLSYDTQVNVGKWRFFARGNVSKNTDESTDSDIWDRHASRVLPSLGGKVKVGEFNTTSRYLPSIPIVGINLFEDYDQIEDKDRTYLPVVTGFAASQALVTVRQGGRVLKQVEVSPGPFEFTDILQVSTGGNIELEIKEKNGKVSNYIIPYTGTEKLLKKGRLSWSGSVGRYDDGYSSEHPWVGQIAVGYGFNNGMTLYGGTMYSEDFSQSLIGGAIDAGSLGALSLQVENSHASNSRGDKDGNVVELDWYKYFEQTQSSFDLTYRRTIEGNISSISSVINSSWGDDWLSINDYVRDELTLSLAQTVSDWGSLSGSFYYSKSKLGNEQQSLSTSLSFPIGRLHGLIQAQNSKYDSEEGRDSDWQVSFQITIPLNLIFPDSSIPYSSLHLSRVQSEGGDWGNQVNFSSTFGKYSDWGFNLYARNDERNGHHDDAYNMSVSYDGAKTRLTLSAGRYNDTDIYSGHLSGGIIGTKYGIDFSSNVYDSSIALMNIPGVEGARFYSAGLDSRGEWQVSHGLDEYRRNTLSLDPNSIPGNVQLISGLEREVIPADGAVIPVIFETFIGHQAVFTVIDENGQILPYCSVAKVENTPEALDPSLVDEQGQAYFSAVPSEGWLEVKWGEDQGISSCRAEYSLKDSEKKNGIYIDTVTCKK